MSYDVYIGNFDGNYTSNVGALFHNHISIDGKTGLQALHGMTGARACSELELAFDSIAKEVYELHESGVNGAPVFCAKYDAKNGWGSTVGALVFLAQILAACANNRRCRVRVSA